MPRYPIFRGRPRPRVPRRPADFVVRDDPMIVVTGETTMVSLSVWGEPVSQPRPTINRRSGHFYDGAGRKKEAFKAVVRHALAEVAGMTFPLFEPGVKLKVTATFNFFRSTKDLDNMVKSLLDCLQGTVYQNDNVVFLLVAKKIRTTRNLAFTQFEVENIVDEDD